MHSNVYLLNILTAVIVVVVTFYVKKNDMSIFSVEKTSLCCTLMLCEIVSQKENDSPQML